MKREENQRIPSWNPITKIQKEEKIVFVNFGIKSEIHDEIEKSV